MLKKKLLSLIFAATLSVNGVSLLSGSCFCNDFNEEKFSDCIKLEDYSWIAQGEGNVNAAYMKQLKNNQICIYSVCRYPDNIEFNLPIETDIDKIEEEIKNIDENIEFNSSKKNNEAKVSVWLYHRTNDGKYDCLPISTAKTIYGIVADDTESFKYQYDTDVYYTQYHDYLTAYDTSFDSEAEDKINKYVNDNSLDAEIIKYNSGDTTFNGDRVDYDTVYVVPNDNMDLIQHYNLSKEIFDETGLLPKCIIPVSLANNSNSKTIDFSECTEGDANNDGDCTIADAVAILQYLANSAKYPLSAQGLINADFDGDGITGADALAIQKMDAMK